MKPSSPPSIWTCFARYFPPALPCSALHCLLHPACSTDGTSLAYALVGSHSNSRAAWGVHPWKGGSCFFIKSYELSVMPLPSWEAAYRRSPQVGFSCVGAAAGSLPGPQPGGLQVGIAGLGRCMQR